MKRFAFTISICVALGALVPLLAQVPLDKKQGVMAAQSEQVQAKEEQRKTKADLDAVNREEDIADNEYKTAKLSLDTAGSINS